MTYTAISPAAATRRPGNHVYIDAHSQTDRQTDRQTNSVACYSFYSGFITVTDSSLSVKRLEIAAVLNLYVYNAVIQLSDRGAEG